jgi:hypothetical protein
MKTSLEIINKLSEKEAVKLESQLVELNLLGDLKKNNSLAEKEFKVYQTNKAKVTVAITEAKSAMRQYAVVLANNVKLINEAKAKAKELGLELPADIVKIETDSNNGKIQFETITKNLQQAEKLI